MIATDTSSKRIPANKTANRAKVVRRIRGLAILTGSILFCRICVAGGVHSRPLVDKFRSVYKRYHVEYVPEAFVSMPSGPLGRATLADADLQLSFTSDEEWKQITTSGKRIGISLVSRRGLPTIVGVTDAAASRRLLPGAVLLAVDGQKVVDKHVTRIRAEMLSRAKGPCMRLTVLNANADVMTIDVDVGGSSKQALQTITKKVQGKDGQEYGYVRVSVLCPGALEAQCGALVKQGVAGLVLDLRDCYGWPGGDMVANAASAFVPEGTLLFVIRSATPRSIKSKRVTAKARTKNISTPLVVLTNGGTANGAELLVAALTDANAARAIGRRTFGTGLIRRVQHLDAIGGYLYVPSGEYLRATGDPLFPSGVAPQQEVATNRANLFYLTNDPAGDAQLQAAIRYLEGEAEKRKRARGEARVETPPRNGLALQADRAR